MEIKKVFFVGLGGAGQRHLRIFNQLLPADTQFSAFRSSGKTPLLNPDFSVNSESSIEDKYELKLFPSLEAGLDDQPDLIVISTPSSLHFDVAMKAAERKIPIFIEKPFSHDLNGFASFREQIIAQNIPFFISFQRRFHPYIQKIKEILDQGALGKIINARMAVASYVPEWHPYEDFRDLYALRKDLGGVLLTEIHELDLCSWFFGLPDNVYCRGGNFSDISLDIEDTTHITLNYQDFSVQVNLCFMQQKNQREIFIAGTQGYLKWNADGNSLIIAKYDEEEEILNDTQFSNDDMFISQAEYFLNNTLPHDSLSNLRSAMGSLAIAEASKASMDTKSEITVNTILEKHQL